MITCPKCLIQDCYYIEPCSSWDKAICSICGYYITWVPKGYRNPQEAHEETSKQCPAEIRVSYNMAQGTYGSICIEDLFKDKIATGSNGKKYVCLDDLTESPFTKGKTNGKTYAGIGVWINDDVDEFGNIAGISLSQSMQEREQKVKKTYIGNLRRSGETAKAATPAPQHQAAAAPVYNDLPF